MLLFTTGCIKSKTAPEPQDEPQTGPLKPSGNASLNIIHFNEQLPTCSVPGLTTVQEQGPNVTLCNYMSMDFEVFGKVQGVSFREYTKEQATKLGLRGWCKNTAKGTVQGHIQGPEDSMETMMNWLREVGSPASEISKAVFRNQQTITELNFNDFSIRRE